MSQSVAESQSMAESDCEDDMLSGFSPAGLTFVSQSGDLQAETLETTREIVRQQDEAFIESLQADQEKDRQKFLQRRRDIEEQAENRIRDEVEREQRERTTQRQMRIEAWYQKIRNDLMATVPEEPPEGLVSIVHVRFRLPDGSRVSRRFNCGDRAEDLYAFAGGHNSVNPRHFRLLVNDVPQPRQLHKEGSIAAAGVHGFTMIIAENTKATTEEEDEPTVCADQCTPVTDYSGDCEVVETEVIDLTTSPAPPSCCIQNLTQLEDRRMTVRQGFLMNGIQYIEVGRISVLDELLKIYEDSPDITSKEIRVKFTSEPGMDGGGITREVFPAFWHQVESSLLEGNIEKVPVITPKTVQCFFQIGRILSHGYVLTGYFPLCLAQAFATILISGVSSVSDDMLIQSFLNYIDVAESQAVNACLSQEGFSESLIEGVIIPMFSRFNCSIVPTVSNLRELITQTARYTLLCQPYYALSEMKRGMLEAHPQMWQKCHHSIATDLRAALVPTSQRVWSMVVEPTFQSSSQARTFDFFRRFVASLSPENLAKLLQFISGSPQCGLQEIKIQFCVPSSSFTRRPTAATCGMVLQLPTTHNSFTTFAREFSEVLANSHMWSFDGI